MQNLIDSRYQSGLEKVQQVGLAVMLIKAEVLKKLRPPLFMMEWVPDTNSYCGEDIYFCQLVQEAGYDVWIDHDLSKQVLHIGHMAFGPDLMRIGPEVKALLEARGEAKTENHKAELRKIRRA